ncbi:MAG: hypothetical protein AMXMBFR77_28540 [Phycisphaerales bacterium]
MMGLTTVTRLYNKIVTELPSIDRTRLAPGRRAQLQAMDRWVETFGERLRQRVSVHLAKYDEAVRRGLIRADQHPARISGLAAIPIVAVVLVLAVVAAATVVLWNHVDANADVKINKEQNATALRMWELLLKAKLEAQQPLPSTLPTLSRPTQPASPLVQATAIGFGGVLIVGAFLAMLHFRPRRRSPA